MSYPKQTLQVRPTKGIAYDTPASELSEEFYSRGQNVQFRNGFARRIRGSRYVYGSPASAVTPIYHLQNYRPSSTNWWITYGIDRIGANETQNVYDITPAGSPGLIAINQPWEWTSADLNGIAIATNGVNDPIYWAGDPNTPFQSLPDWPTATFAKGIVAFRYHLFAYDLEDSLGIYRDSVMWSSAAAPGNVPASWTPAATNDAGEPVTLGDTPGPILTAVPLRGTLLFFKRSSTYGCDWVGGEDIFSFRTLFASKGALTRHAAVDIGDKVFVVSDGDIGLTDGTNWDSVAQGRMKDVLFASIDQNHYENLFVVFNRAKNEVWVCFPESGNQLCTKALIYNIATDAFGERDLDDVACAAIGVVNDTDTDETIDAATYLLDSSEAQRLLNSSNFSLANEALVTGSVLIEQHDTEDSVAVNASVGKYDMTLGDAIRVKFVKNVHIRAKPGFGTLYVRVGARMTTTSAITWGAERALNEPNQVVNCFAQGRYISVEVRSQDENVWELSGIDIEYELRGYY